VYFAAILFIDPGRELKNATDSFLVLPLFPISGALVGGAIGHAYEYRLGIDSADVK